jgi:hypothetical protein
LALTQAAAAGFSWIGSWSSGALPTILVPPLVGFDSAGYGLGYGGGFLDRTQAHLRPRPSAIGVGYPIGLIWTIYPQPTILRGLDRDRERGVNAAPESLGALAWRGSDLISWCKCTAACCTNAPSVVALIGAMHRRTGIGHKTFNGNNAPRAVFLSHSNFSDVSAFETC